MMGNNGVIVNKIRDMRVAKNLTQAQMAEALNINRATYINIESGKRKLNVDELAIICNRLGVSISELTMPTNTEKEQSEEKLKQIYLYILKKHFSAGVPKTKLAKLLYLIDFTNYYERGCSMSGSRYYRLDYGPVAEKFFVLTDKLFDKGEINIDILDFAQMISISNTNTEMDPSILTDDEKKIIDKICEYWKNKRTSEIVNFTHSQKPWKDRVEGEYIPYESIKEEPKNRIYAPLN